MRFRVCAKSWLLASSRQGCCNHKPGLHGSVGVFEKGPQDASRIKDEHGVDAAEAFRPGAAQEFVQHRFRLVVQGVGGDNGVCSPSTISWRKKA